MAIVEPFAAFRADPFKTDLSRVLCPPYDIVTPSMAKRLRRWEANAIRIELPEDPDRYRRAQKQWEAWVGSHLLVQDKKPGFYICEQSFRWNGKTRTRLGFLAALRLEKPGSKTILAHENTLSKPKQDRRKLLNRLKVNTSPIFAVFSDPKKEFERFFRRPAGPEPAIRGQDIIGVGYRLWKIQDAGQIRRLKRLLEPQKILIADGHHRYRVAWDFYRSSGPLRRAPGTRMRRSRGGAAASSPRRYILAYLCPREDPGLKLLPTHRVVPGAGRLMRRLSGECSLEPLRSWKELSRKLDKLSNPLSFGCFSERFPGRPYVLATPGKNASDGARLAVQYIAQALAPQAARQTFTHSAPEAIRLARACKGMALLLGSYTVSQIQSATEACGLLPQKTTYFYPKVAAGLAFRRL